VEFRGTVRFEVRRKLGAGGFGTVYEAFDRERESRVALKTLHESDATALYRFKHEFRALADVHHPNLVTLYELFQTDEHFFFTMELVVGQRLLDYVRRSQVTATSPTGRVGDRVGEQGPEGAAPAGGAGAVAVAEAAFDEARLRSAIGQLAMAVQALHDAGKVHRDIKPSNVLVTASGRAVLLDFGLATELRPHVLDMSAGLEVVGTLAYMAPEQVDPSIRAPASDWYGVGVILHEALAGKPPFPGTFHGVFEKQRREPPPPSAACRGVPADLDALAVDLLRIRPEDRPPGAEVLRRLGATLRVPVAPAAGAGPGAGVGAGVGAVAAAAARGPAAAPGPVDESFIGREREQDALARAFEASRRGRAVTVHVHGPSGMGKSALARHFVDSLLARGDTVVLAGRCYERESVPYKAVDSLMDGLCRFLMKLPAGEAEALLPRDVAPLARMFPVLGRVKRIAAIVARAPETPDRQELRRRGFLALRDLLGLLSARGPVVLFIDDLQWGDLDSALLLQDVLRPPDSPAILLVGCYRTEEAASSPFLRTYLAPPSPGRSQPVADVRVVEVGPLAPADATALARALLDPAGRGAAAGDGAAAAGARLAEAIARESGGNPFFVGELARHVQEAAAGGGPGQSTLSLNEVLAARVARLGPAPRLLLETVAVAGRPLPRVEAMEAAELDPEAREPAVLALRAARFVRTRLAGPGAEEEVLETAHDRIRESVVAGLAADRVAARHRRLAEVLEAAFRRATAASAAAPAGAAAPTGPAGKRAGGPDPETIAAHLRAAGDTLRAGEYAAIAAALAAASLAFDRAARLYRLALDPLPGDPATVQARRLALADALANAGRGAEAAAAYLETARGARERDALELERRAAEQLLRSGHLDQGLAVVRRVLEAANLKAASTPRGALVSVVARRAWLRVRGLGFKERKLADLPPAVVARLDAAWALSTSLGVVDTVRGADFQIRHLLLALDAGEPYRVARALALEVAYEATGGRRARRRTEVVAEAAEALARRVGEPQAMGLALTTAAIAAFLEGHFRRSVALADRADRILRDRCSNVAWELASGNLFGLWALYYLGELDIMTARQRALTLEADERGDLFAGTGLRAGATNAVWLVADDPETARAELDRAMAPWTDRHGYLVAHSYDLFARTQIDLYVGDAEAAFRRMRDGWAAIARSQLLRIRHMDLVMRHLRARTAIATARRLEAGDPERAARLDLAVADARRIARDGTFWARPLGRLIDAGVAALRGEKEAAVRDLGTAAAGFADAQMELFAAAARRLRGDLLGGEEGSTLKAEAAAYLERMKVADPARLVNLLAPGFDGAGP